MNYLIEALNTPYCEMTPLQGISLFGVFLIGLSVMLVIVHKNYER